MPPSPIPPDIGSCGNKRRLMTSGRIIGQGITGTWQGGSFRLMAINLDRGALAPLFPPAPANGPYTLGGFSPGGRYLSFVSVRAGRVHLGALIF